MKVSIVIPFLNEEENLPDLLSQMEAHCSAWDFESELILVNDGSTDASMSILGDAQAVHFNMKVVDLSRNFGSHAALRAGISVAEGDYISFLYADLQDPPELIEQMQKIMSDGKDIVWAHREIKEAVQSPLAQLASNWYNKLMRKYVNPDFPTSGFDIVMFNRKVADELNKNIEANSSIFLQILNLGFRQEHITYEKRSRHKGKSKWTLTKKLKLFIDSFVAFSYFPIRLVSVVGIVFFILGILWSLYIVLRELIWGDLQAGWPTLIAILMIGFGITNIGLGIVAEYLWRTLDASRERPVFVINEVLEIKKKQT
jgi:dolichol-phosphate mannosyltransferase